MCFRWNSFFCLAMLSNRHLSTVASQATQPGQKKRSRRWRRTNSLDAFNARAASILSDASKPVQQRLKLVASLVPPVSATPPSRSSSENVLAQDVAVRVLANVQRLGWKANHALLYNLVYCAFLDRDWDLIADMLPELQEPQCDLAQVWSLFLPLLSIENPSFAIRLVSVHLLSNRSTNSGQWKWSVLSNRTVAHAIVSAAKSSQAHQFLDTLASCLVDCVPDHNSSPLLQEVTIISASHPHFFSQSTCERLRTLASPDLVQAPSGFIASYLFHASLANQQISQALQLAATSPGNCMPALVRALLRQSSPTLRDQALRVFQTFVDFKHMPISDAQFLAFVNAAPSSYACDWIWYRFHREHGMRLTHRSALSLLVWTATHVPDRLLALVHHLVNDRVRLSDADLRQWQQFFTSLRNTNTLSMHKLDEVALAVHSIIDVNLSTPSHATLDSLFVQHFAQLGRADTLRYFLRYCIRTLPVSKNTVRAITASFPQTIAFSLLGLVWHLTRTSLGHRNSPLSADQWDHWIKLHQSLQLISSMVRPKQCHLWTKRLEDTQRAAQHHHHQPPVWSPPRGETRRSSNWNVLIPLIRSLGKLGESDSLMQLADSSARDPSSPPEQVSALAIAFARCGEVARAQALLAQVDPSSHQYRSAHAAVLAAEFRSSIRPMAPPLDSPETEPQNLATICDPISFNLHLTSLRNQGRFDQVISTAISIKPPLIDAATLTIVITSALRGLDALETAARLPSPGRLLPRSSSAIEQDATRMKMTVYDFVLLHAPRVGHRYHAHLLLDLLVATRPSLMPWSTVVNVLSAMLNGSFGGTNRLSGINHGRPSAATIARVHNLMLGRLKEVGLWDYGTAPSGARTDQDGTTVERDPNLQIDRLEALAIKNREHASELQGMVDLLEWMDVHLSKGRRGEGGPGTA
ncbi:hypothetical protein BCR44DRAFT_89310 [Catenaria anguillulae PL171]|uniref:Uncharacterized protein n=1 Tax=Catenaria anguillulae PL171 TaxID=765915 RepID=A0A1Y2HMW5_9FUNG|nr:hypothetical protein BCR44DRAFT_89310 [Catenaria anguillulae PL171]